MEDKYPLLKIDLAKLRENTIEITSTCRELGISVSGVIKGCAGNLEVAKALVDGGCDSLASSRISQLQDVKELSQETQTLLLRLPMLSEIESVIRYADISLNSDKSTLEALNKVCLKENKIHKVILMTDLGDLREGIWLAEELLELAEYVEFHLSALQLYGIGTNLGCYGSIKPTKDKMLELSDLATSIEKRIGRELEIVSGGATSSYPLVVNNEMPKKINHLRMGESILLGRDLKDYFGLSLPNIHSDTFQLFGQIIEIQEKPSYPVGEIFIDAFGNTPEYKDIGLRKRAILAVGKQDFGDHDKLIPINQSIQIVGSSSDHLIIDITDDVSHYCTGDIIGFKMYYQSMLYLCLNTDIDKLMIDE